MLAITNLTSQGSIFPQNPISDITLQQLIIDDTYEQVAKQPHTKIFRPQYNLLLTNDELKDWIPQPFPFLTTKPPTPLLSHFPLMSHLFPLPSFSSNSTGVDSNYSTQKVFSTISSLINSDL